MGALLPNHNATQEVSTTHTLKKVRPVSICQYSTTHYYAQGEPLAFTAINELRKLLPITSDLRRLTKQVDRRAFHYVNTAQRETHTTTPT